MGKKGLFTIVFAFLIAIVSLVFIITGKDNEE